MYICICNALNEKQFRSAAEEGARCADDAFDKLGCKPVCGQCVKVIEDTFVPQAIAKSNFLESNS